MFRRTIVNRELDYVSLGVLVDRIDSSEKVNVSYLERHPVMGDISKHKVVRGIEFRNLISLFEDNDKRFTKASYAVTRSPLFPDKHFLYILSGPRIRNYDSRFDMLVNASFFSDDKTLADSYVTRDFSKS